MAKRKPQKNRNRRGAALVLIALLCAILVGMVAFAVEVGRMYLVRSQLQTAVDAGALAASLQLKQDPTDIPTAQAAAEQFVQLNSVGWLVTVPQEAITIESGVWDADLKTFSTTTVDPTAVRVSAGQDNEPLLFARVLGQTSFGVDLTAIASGSGSDMDIMMVLDMSGSMGSDGRIEALQNAAPAFVDVIDDLGGDDQISVMGYGVDPDNFDPGDDGSGTPYIMAPSSEYPADSDWVGVLEADLTDGFAGLKSGALSSSSLTDGKYGGGTPIGAGIRDAAHYLTASSYSRSEAKPVMVLMSDGHANKPSDSGDSYALQMAAYANSLDVKIYTISLGNSADENLMEAIAAATGGEHFAATGSGSSQLTDVLTDAFQQAAFAIKRTLLVE